MCGGVCGGGTGWAIGKADSPVERAIPAKVKAHITALVLKKKTSKESPMVQVRTWGHFQLISFLCIGTDSVACHHLYDLILLTRLKPVFAPWPCLGIDASVSVKWGSVLSIAFQGKDFRWSAKNSNPPFGHTWGHALNTVRPL